MTGEKQKVAFSSVIAAVFLTVIKVVVGVFTGSLGILSEAAHSLLDLCAAVVTFFAVRISDKPADNEHNYGHGKIESFSALIETFLLFVTCAWIIYEAVHRLFFGGLVIVSFTESLWGMGIMVLSVVINISRARLLRKTAKKYGSQALEADALHFDTDVWSSYVVIAGLLLVGVGDLFKISVLKYGDPIAALGVSVLVIVVSAKLGKRTIDALLDTAPKGMVNDVLHEVNEVKGVMEVGKVRIRPSGPSYFIDLNVGISRNESHRVVHSIVDEIRERLQHKIANSDIVISTYPIDVAGTEDNEVYHVVKKIVDKFPVCTNIHNIHIYEISGKKYIAIHIEVKECMNLNQSHELSHTIGGLIEEAVRDVVEVSVNFEYVNRRSIQAEDITDSSGETISKICGHIKEVSETINCHDIKVYRQGNKLTIFLHCEVEEDYTTEITEQITKKITNKIRDNISDIESVHIHFEPVGSN